MRRHLAIYGKLSGLRTWILPPFSKCFITLCVLMLAEMQSIDPCNSIFVRIAYIVYGDACLQAQICSVAPLLHQR